MTKTEAIAAGVDVSKWPEPWWVTDPAAFAAAKAAHAERAREAASRPSAVAPPIERADPWAQIIANLNARPLST